MKLYTVYNTSIDEATNPFMVKSDKVAIMNFKNGLSAHLDKEPKFDVSALNLFCLGSLNPETMELIPAEPYCVYKGTEYLGGLDDE